MQHSSLPSTLSLCQAHRLYHPQQAQFGARQNLSKISLGILISFTTIHSKPRTFHPKKANPVTARQAKALISPTFLAATLPAIKPSAQNQIANTTTDTTTKSTAAHSALGNSVQEGIKNDMSMPAIPILGNTFVL
jgi:hypothetical protein